MHSKCLKLFYSLGARTCPESVKAHLTRCDMYYKCMTLPSDNLVWIAKICPSGLVYDTKYKNCVLPGEKYLYFVLRKKKNLSNNNLLFLLSIS